MKALLVDVLKDPEQCPKLTLADWDVLIPQGRVTGLLGTLCLMLEARDLLASVPAAVRRHLESALCTHRKQSENLEYELMWLQRAMAEMGEKLILLKGAAYIVGELPAGAGRLISDIDLLVPEKNVPRAEQTLREYGWESAEDDPYNDRYYRKWMHEIPPMAHVERDSVLDVHHTILPPTADEKLSPEKLFEQLEELVPGVFALSPLDMVLHSATHLFHEGEFLHGLRDLLDLDRLLRHFSAADDRFWNDLVARATEMDMLTSLFLALRYSRMFFETPVPAAVEAEVESRLPRFPGVAFFDFLFVRAFLPDHASCVLAFTPFARFCLYVRSHYLRMPLYLLLPHLLRKAWVGRFGRPVTHDEAAGGEG